jgi:hypothetical protein
MQLPSRREALLAAATCILLLPCGTGLLADVPTNAKLIDSANQGRRFLESLFDPTLDLLPEYQGAKVYWLFHDNYLAAKVLATSNAGLAEKIKAAIKGFGIDRSGKIEIVFGEAQHPLPFRQYKLNEVQRIGEKIIRTEVVQDTVLKGWQKYADLLFLAAMAEEDPKQARQHLDDGLKMWEGTGFKDSVVTKHHTYATYKLALSLMAAAKLKVNVDVQSAIIERLLSLQAKEGGWITDYDENGKPVGVANVETTCLAILGLEAVAKSC